MSASTVTACFAAAHHRLDRLVAEVSDSVSGSDLRAARFYFKELARHLRSHLYFEETFMFPLLEMACGANGPMCVLRREHEEIESRLGGLQASLFLGSLADVRAELAALVATLENHNGREERVLYPMIDRELDDHARGDLIAAIQLHL